MPPDECPVCGVGPDEFVRIEDDEETGEKRGEAAGAGTPAGSPGAPGRRPAT